MDIDKEESIAINYDKNELEILRDQYTEFLLDIYLEMKQRCKDNSFMWFDQCNFPEFMEMALDLSTGPPSQIFRL